MKKSVWRKTYGDGELTDDYVLWIDGEPTDVVISPLSGCWSLMNGKEEIYIADTVKECKEAYSEIMVRQETYKLASKLDEDIEADLAFIFKDMGKKN